MIAVTVGSLAVVAGMLEPRDSRHSFIVVVGVVVDVVGDWCSWCGCKYIDIQQVR